MSSMNTLMNKLLKALEYEHGIIYCLDKRQFYSELYEKRFTKYRLHRTFEDEEGNQIKENHEFNKQLDVVLFLVEQLRGVKT